jgi:hypothetical protein
VIVDGLALRTCGMEIEESANVWLVVIHSGWKEGSFARQIFDENTNVLAIDLFVGDAVDEDIRIFVVGDPDLGELRPWL